MMWGLTSPTESGWRECVGSLLDAAAVDGMACIDIAVSDDVLFEEKWLPIGVLTVPDEVDPPGAVSRPRGERLARAAQRGEFLWRLPEFEATVKALKALLPDDSKSTESDLRRPLEAVGHAAARCGLVTPTFDAGLVRELPLRRPAIVVPDACAVTQGGLDACARLLRPALRVKIPSVVQMEIVNMADGYFARRRAMDKPKAKPLSSRGRLQALLNRVNSQGGQRALLRLSLSSGLDIERVAGSSDPLRGIASLSVEQEDRDLGVTVIARSYADRLVVESALNTKESAGQQEVFLLTSDQGVAKMAIGDGIRPIYFEAVGPAAVFGRVLTGTCFPPFPVPGEPRIQSTSLGLLCWELAVTFGSCRLTVGAYSVSVAAMGKTLRWMPYHATDDLLWVSSVLPSPATSAAGSTNASTGSPASAVVKSEVVKGSPKAVARLPRARPVATHGHARPSRPLVGTFSVRLPSLVALLASLGGGKSISDKAGKALVGVSADRRYGDYRNFLIAANLARQAASGLTSTDEVTSLREALLVRNHSRALELFCNAPSFRAFVEGLGARRVLRATDSVPGVSMKDGFSSYAPIVEALGAGLRIGAELVWTGQTPDPGAFAEAAISAFDALRRGGETYVLTGDWLVALGRAGIHPEMARNLLEDAHGRALLERYVEGSSPATADKSQTMWRLESSGGQPVAVEVDLYDGGFLAIGRASVNLRIVRVPE